MTENQQETASDLREAMRIFNEAVRKAVKSGLVVEWTRIEARNPAGLMPWISVCATAKTDQR